MLKDSLALRVIAGLMSKPHGNHHQWRSAVLCGARGVSKCKSKYKSKCVREIEIRLGPW